VQTEEEEEEEEVMIIITIWLVVSTPLKKYEFVSWDDEIPNNSNHITK